MHTLNGVPIGEAIEDCSTGFELRELTIKGASNNAFAQKFEAVGFGFDRTTLMITALLLPEGRTKPFCCA
jgi:hypothetical protein